MYGLIRNSVSNPKFCYSVSNPKFCYSIYLRLVLLSNLKTKLRHNLFTITCATSWFRQTIRDDFLRLFRAPGLSFSLKPVNEVMFTRLMASTCVQNSIQKKRGGGFKIKPYLWLLRPHQRYFASERGKLPLPTLAGSLLYHMIHVIVLGLLSWYRLIRPVKEQTLNDVDGYDVSCLVL